MQPLLACKYSPQSLCFALADYALTFPDVYFVTMRQLLGWMANPVAKDELTPEILGCGSKGGAPGTAALARERRRRQLLRSS
jgi:hypothetical protein